MMTEQFVGWDGQSRPIVVLEAECGCRYTRDGKALLRPCISHIKAAWA